MKIWLLYKDYFLVYNQIGNQFVINLKWIRIPKHIRRVYIYHLGSDSNFITLTSITMKLYGTVVGVGYILSGQNLITPPVLSQANLDSCLTMYSSSWNQISLRPISDPSNGKPRDITHLKRFWEKSSKMRHAICVYGFCFDTHLNQIISIPNSYKRIMFNAFCTSPVKTLTAEFGIIDV